MLVPGIDDLLQVLLDQVLRLVDHVIGQSDLCRRLHVGLQPKLRLTFGVGHMTCIFGSSREKKKKRNGPSRNTVGVMTMLISATTRF